MANQMLFPGTAQRSVKTNTFNEAGATAYRLSDKHTLAQYAVTGCLNGTYYAGAETQLEQVIEGQGPARGPGSNPGPASAGWRNNRASSNLVAALIRGCRTISQSWAFYDT